MPVSIRVSELKNEPSSFVMERLKRAAAEGTWIVAVLNRGRPVANLAPADHMPAKWRATAPETVPLNELKRSEVSITRLRREGTALYLSQRSGPTLAVWPVEDGHTRPAEVGLSAEVDRLRGEVQELRRQMKQVKELLANFGAMAAGTLTDEQPSAAGEKLGSEGVRKGRVSAEKKGGKKDGSLA